MRFPWGSGSSAASAVAGGRWSWLAGDFEPGRFFEGAHVAQADRPLRDRRRNSLPAAARDRRAGRRLEGRSRVRDPARDSRHRRAGPVGTAPRLAADGARPGSLRPDRAATRCGGGGIRDLRAAGDPAHHLADAVWDARAAPVGDRRDGGDHRRAAARGRPAHLRGRPDRSGRHRGADRGHHRHRGSEPGHRHARARRRGPGRPGHRPGRLRLGKRGDGDRGLEPRGRADVRMAARRGGRPGHHRDPDPAQGPRVGPGAAAPLPRDRNVGHGCPARGGEGAAARRHRDPDRADPVADQNRGTLGVQPVHARHQRAQARAARPPARPRSASAGRSRTTAWEWRCSRTRASSRG